MVKISRCKIGADNAKKIWHLVPWVNHNLSTVEGVQIDLTGVASTIRSVVAPPLLLPNKGVTTWASAEVADVETTIEFCKRFFTTVNASEVKHTTKGLLHSTHAITKGEILMLDPLWMDPLGSCGACRTLEPFLNDLSRPSRSLKAPLQPFRATQRSPWRSQFQPIRAFV